MKGSAGESPQLSSGTMACSKLTGTTADRQTFPWARRPAWRADTSPTRPEPARLSLRSWTRQLRPRRGPEPPAASARTWPVPRTNSGTSADAAGHASQGGPTPLELPSAHRQRCRRTGPPKEWRSAGRHDQGTEHYDYGRLFSHQRLAIPMELHFGVRRTCRQRHMILGGASSGQQQYCRNTNLA